MEREERGQDGNMPHPLVMYVRCFSPLVLMRVFFKCYFEKNQKLEDSSLRLERPVRDDPTGEGEADTIPQQRWIPDEARGGSCPVALGKNVSENAECGQPRVNSE